VHEVHDQLVVFAYDPGKVTGWAMWAPATEAFACGQVEGRHAFYRSFEGVMSSGVRLEVCGEKYTIGGASKGKTAQYDALYINGYIDGLCEKAGIPLTLRTATQAKGFATNDKLKALGWYKATPGGHAADATRHLLTHLCQGRAELGGGPLLEQIVEAIQ
jgi:hypothetical protein